MAGWQRQRSAFALPHRRLSSLMMTLSWSGIQGNAPMLRLHWGTGAVEFATKARMLRKKTW